MLTQRCCPAWYPAPLCTFDQKEPSFTVPVQTPLRGSRPVCCPQRLRCFMLLWSLRFRSRWGREPEPRADRSQGPLPSFFWAASWGQAAAGNSPESARCLSSSPPPASSDESAQQVQDDIQKRGLAGERNKPQSSRVKAEKVSPSSKSQKYLNIFWFSCSRGVE